MNNSQKLLVCLYSDPNFLALNILEILISKNCVVGIVSDDKEEWNSKTSHLNKSSRFSVISTKDYKNLNSFSYAVFCGGLLKKENAYSDFRKFISNKNFGNAKTMAIFPFETFSLKESSNISISNNAGLVYVGDLLGPRIDLDSDLLLSKTINEMVEKRSATLAVGEMFYPIFCPDAARSIVKWLLSFGPYGKETFLLGPQLSSSNFWKQNIKSFPGLKIVYDTELETRFVPKGYNIVTLNSNINLSFSETYKWLIKKPKMPVVKKPQIKKPSRLKFIRPFILPIFLILLFPLITALIASGFMFLSYKQFLSEDIQNSENNILLAKTIFVIGKGESDILSHIPILGKFYDETSFISESGEVAADLSTTGIPMVESGKGIFDNIFSDSVSDIRTPSSQLRSGLSNLNNKISQFGNETESKANSGVLVAKQVLQLIDFNKFINLTRESSILANTLPSILGTGNNKNYLILFENNMELRPTGGFIGSYGVANFGNGKLSGLDINDIYSADGQLKGHVEPPAPIKNYLGEANWWFRDSNWDPDFPTSAQRAEWFLGKEMNQQVDGVIAIDLMPIKNILKFTGPIFLPDYNLTITSDNLYEKTQEEAQANSFAGSRQKASFLTALSRSLIAQFSKMDSKDRLLILKSLYDDLQGRHIQVYLHDPEAADALNKLNWSGEFQTYSCGNSCYSDFVGDVEANVGDNKSNYFINRSIDLKVNFNGQYITRNMTINLQNSANPSLGPSGVYKTYVRILVPQDAEVLGVKSVIGQNSTELSPEITQENGRQEVGVFTQVQPEQQNSIVFTWQNGVSGSSDIKNYGLYVRKQAGIDDSPISVEFSGVGSLISQPIFTLTNGGVYTYNTDLTQDFFARLSWK